MSEACTRFTAALNLAAVNYEEFAYATAGTGDSVDYRDPNVWQSNVIGRTALREAAREALDASRTPGTPPEVSGPMRSWSLGATKLLMIMGLRGGGDSLNAAATALNADAQNTQMACALSANRP
jgi:SpoVK/Ycf46/Vps4 family AAA+-type ATPase